MMSTALLSFAFRRIALARSPNQAFLLKRRDHRRIRSVSAVVLKCRLQFSTFAPSRPDEPAMLANPGNNQAILTMKPSGLAGNSPTRGAFRSLLLVFCAFLLFGCGESETNQTNIPTDFAATLEKEHPELFVKKSGKNKTEVLGGRDKRDVIRREWLKSQGRGD